MLPAYAGMIPRRTVESRQMGRAPRVCGDDPPSSTGAWPTTGVLPAYAGMIPRQNRQVLHRLRAPRVCGDDPMRKISANISRPCSPRMRG